MIKGIIVNDNGLITSMIETLHNDRILAFVKVVLLVIGVVIITIAMNAAMKRRNFSVHSPINCAVMVFVSVLMVSVGGMSLWTIKGIIFALILLYAAVQDISTHQVDDFIWIMICILALVGIETFNFKEMILSGLVLFVPQVAISCMSKNGGIGGADIKISTASAILIGSLGGVMGYMHGIIIAIITRMIYCKTKGYSLSEPFALMPFLSMGLVIGYFFS